MLRFLTGLILILCNIGCTKNGPGIPGLVSYFTFADKNRIARVEARDFIVERIDPNDSTKVLLSRRLSSYNFVQFYQSRAYTLLFEPNDDIFNAGLNKVCKVRFRYDGLPGVVDWLEYKNTAEEWVNPTDVKFNGQPVPRRDSNEPVERSYLYVLQ
jgi:hypothetical protein